MDNPNHFSLNLDTYVECIARGHAFNKHALGKDHKPGMKGLNAFRARQTKPYFDEYEQKEVGPKRLGEDLFIETPDDLAHYIKNSFLTSDATSGYVDPRDNSVNLYNEKDNVALHFSWKNAERDLGTIYRYERTGLNFKGAKNRAEEAADTLGVEFQSFSNEDNLKTCKDAVERLIYDMNMHPQGYLMSGDPYSTVQDRILSCDSRPGRSWERDQVLHAPNNLKGHSPEYAEHTAMDIPAEDMVCVQSESAKELNVGRVRKNLRSGRLLGYVTLDALLAANAEPELV